MNNIIDSIQLSGTVYTLSAQTGGGGVPESTFTAYTASTDSRISIDEEVTAAGLNALNEKIENLDGTATVELTQAEYDALVTAGTVSADTYYIITDAQAVDLTQYWTSAQTQSAINQATSGKVDTSSVVSSVTSASTDSEIPTAKAVYDAIPTGGTGGGKAVSGGTNISITTGETADTINCTLPITTSNNNRCIITGTEGTKGSAEGMGTYESFITGRENKATNYAEAAFGRYNRSNHNSDTFGDSGNTLFSVGNGSGKFTRHNAFEVRENGDVYISSGGTDIKLQDHLGGGGSITVDTALDSGSTNPVENRVIYNKIDEVEQVTAAALNQINEKLVEDEEVTAAALNNLNDAIQEKQDQLSAGTNITISGNVISAEGGGGKTIVGGRGITVTSGETADTVSFNLALSAGTRTDSIIIGESTNISNANRSIATGYKTKAQQSNAFAQGYQTDAGQEQSHAEGYQTKAYGVNSHSEGRGTSAMTAGSHTEGLNTITSNSYEHTQGQYNVSNKANTTFGDSGNTLFSVGNGTSSSARHNAFEIRQNGDIYCSDGTNDVKLQDTITATAANTTALGGLSLVKLSQTEYNNLQTKDNNTLYVIVN